MACYLLLFNQAHHFRTQTDNQPNMNTINTEHSNNNNVKILNKEVINALKSDVSEEGLMVMLGVFRDELSQRLERLESAVENRDLSVLRSESHTLVSISGQFGATALRGIVEKVNEYCRNDRLPDAVVLGDQLAEIGSQTINEVNNMIDDMERL